MFAVVALCFGIAVVIGSSEAWRTDGQRDVERAGSMLVPRGLLN